MSRFVDRQFVLEEREKERFLELMRAYLEFCGIQIVTFCILSNHFHILIRVPHRPADGNLRTDEELVRLADLADCSYCGPQLETDLKALREEGNQKSMKYEG